MAFSEDGKEVLREKLQPPTPNDNEIENLAVSESLVTNARSAHSLDVQIHLVNGPLPPEAGRPHLTVICESTKDNGVICFMFIVGGAFLALLGLVISLISRHFMR